MVFLTVASIVFAAKMIDGYLPIGVGRTFDVKKPVYERDDVCNCPPLIPDP